MARFTPRLLLAAPLAAVALLAGGAAPALGVDPACTFNAGEGNNLTLGCQANDRQINDLHIGLQPGAEAGNVSAREAGVSCSSPPGFPGNIDCIANPPRPPGSSLTIDLSTQSPYQSNDQDSFFGSDGSSNFGPIDIGGPDRSQPPPPGCDNWDWEVTVEPAEQIAIDPNGVVHFDIVGFRAAGWRTVVKNLGPCPSPATVLHMAPNSTGRLLLAGSVTTDEERYPVLCSLGVGDDRGSFRCPIVGLAPGAETFATTSVKEYRRLDGNALSFVDCQVTPEQNGCANNTAEFEFVQFSSRRAGTDEAVPGVVRDQPSRRLRRIRGAVQTAGSAQKTTAAGRRRSKRKVQIALVRLPDAVGQQCRWLRNARGKFLSKDPSVDRCVDPIWLKAKGTERWVYRLRKRLPKGDYLLYARAFDKKGRPQVDFDDQNTEEFTLR